MPLIFFTFGKFLHSGLYLQDSSFLSLRFLPSYFFFSAKILSFSNELNVPLALGDSFVLFISHVADPPIFFISFLARPVKRVIAGNVLG